MSKKQKAFKATLDFWDWARKQNNVTCDKASWPEYVRIKDLLCECAFCEYYLVRGAIATKNKCVMCTIVNEIDNCFFMYSCFHKWASSEEYRKTIKGQINLQKKCAEKIYQATLKYYNKEFK